ncbi:MAG: phosphatase PAP2 family protein [Hyphomicrobiales bacterium]|nr:phosphatase PAP2 family protein [Hyphomicrobiales bacterium]MDE2113589.1 phosphatase PAP2 family protein [Hyphomicrobiales bacterium]
MPNKPDTMPERDERRPARLGTWPWLLGAFLVAIAVFVLFPNLDLTVARSFYLGQHQFIGQGPWGNFWRSVGNVTPFLVLAFIAFAYFMRWRGKTFFYRPSGKDFAFVALAMLLGPGVIVNLVMKDHLHRPRPVQVTQLDGYRPFMPFYRFNGACPRNCSFPSGEGAEAFWMVAPAALVPPPWRAPALAGAVVFGVLTSALRLAFGGHFLSDTVFAALIMWGLMMGLRRWIYGPDSP